MDRSTCQTYKPFELNKFIRYNTKEKSMKEEIDILTSWKHKASLSKDSGRTKNQVSD